MANKIKESNITDSAVTTSKIADNAITSDKIAPGAVVAADVGDGTITTAKIADSNVTTAKIADSNVTSAKIAADAIDGTKIADDSINSEHITDGSVDNVHLAGSIANDKLANSSITINGTSIALGASGNIVAGTDWQSVVTADGSTATTSSAGEGYFIDTTSAAHTINLPATPTQGDEVHIVDYAGTFGTNKVTIERNGSNIDGSTANGSLAIDRLNVRFVYIDSTQGWKAIFDDASENYGAAYVTATGGTVTTSGDFKIHTFTGDGTFVVCSIGNPAGGADTVDYLVVAGGGGGGGGVPGDGGAGGGAGGFRMSNSSCMPAPLTSPLATPTGLTVTATTYPVTVGGGGTLGGPVAPSGEEGGKGSDSIFSTITSTGGGGGDGTNNSASTCTSGGSGGGAHQEDVGAGKFTGNTPPVSPPQGNPGGGFPSTPNASGGGGAGAAGGTPPGTAGSTGGIGTFVLGTGFAGSNGTTGPVCGARYFAGGGAGGGAPGRSYPDIPNDSNDGRHGGGGASGSAPRPGTANTGGGGGGGSDNPGGTGGKGIVIIRYKFQ
jgi:hypothetical protein